MVIPEPSGHIAGRLHNPNPEEAEENDFKCNFMKMKEMFKEEIKSSLKEMVEKTNKNLEEMNKSRKESQGKKSDRRSKQFKT